MTYILDANIFIEAKNRHYGFDFCPAFWQWLIQQNQNGVVFSIEKVGNELKAGTDELANWASQRGQNFFLPPDAAMIPAMTTVSNWVSNQHYHQSAITTFLQDADFYLIAYALAHGHTVVTHEKHDSGLKQVKIPTPCIALSVSCISPFEMLRNEHARFVLGP